MAKRINSALTSLDLYLADETGRFRLGCARRGRPDRRQRSAAAGRHASVCRRTYEVLVAWVFPDMEVGQPPHFADFAGIWRGADEIAFPILESTRAPDG